MMEGLSGQILTTTLGAKVGDLLPLFPRFAFLPFFLLFIPGLDVADHDHQVAAVAGRVLDQVFEHRLDGKAGLFEGVEGALGLEVNLGDELFQAEFPGQFDDLVDEQGAQAPALVIRRHHHPHIAQVALPPLPAHVEGDVADDAAVGFHHPW